MAINSQSIILSLGGSLIHPKEGINIKFLKLFNILIREQVKNGRRFFIVCGGGNLSRTYQDAAKAVIGEIPDEDIDWLGIHATKLNAQLLRTIFSDITIHKIIFKYDRLDRNINEPVVICAGWKPGWSTDYCATLLARDYGAKNIVNLSNIEVVYDKDPNKFPNAKPIEKIGWEDFQKLVGDKWSPGANVPFDPVATKLSKDLDLSVFIVKGSNIRNLENLLNGRPFKGSIIMPYRLDNSFFNREYYELGIGYKGYTTTKRGRIRSHLANFYRALSIKMFLKPKSVLDIGCGTGLLVYYLRKMGIDAKGLEVSHYALSKAYPSIGEYLRYGDILDIPYSYQSFDLVTSFNVLEHLDINGIKKALSECQRVSRKFILHKIYTEENGWIKKFHNNDLSKISVFPKTWWSNLFKKEGYNEVNIYYPHLPEYMESIFVLDGTSE